MYNYFEFNDNIINDIAIVCEIDKPSLSKKQIDTINIPSRHGEIFNGCSYDPIEVKISMLIQGDNEADYQDRLKTLHEIFKTTKEVKVAFSEDKFLFGIVSDEFRPVNKTKLSSHATIKIICHIPYCYSNDLKLFNTEDDNKTIVVTNEGGEPAIPFISIGFSKDTHYVQLENTETGQRILVGAYPSLSLTSVKKQSLILHDDCTTLSNWSQSGSSIDSDRSSNGTFGITDSGNAICLATLGDGSTSWKGSCMKTKNLSEELDEFSVQAYFRHNSSGKNGDPTILDIKADTSTGEVGEKTVYYEVKVASLNVRTGPGTKYKKIGALKRGHKITSYTLEKGWIKFKYTSSKTGYVCDDHCKKVTKTNQVSAEIQNMVVVSNGKNNVKLMATPHYSGKLVTTIRTGEVVRVIKYKHTDKDKNGNVRYYYKLAKKYKGKYAGYICTGNLKSASAVSVDYDYSSDANIADDKTGVISLYLFDINGSRLAKIEFIDEQKYFEYTKPIVRIGSRTVLQDTTKVPNPKSITVDDNGTLKTTNYLSDKLGDWNEFYGKVTLKRYKENNKYVWDVVVQKIVDGVVKKTMATHNIKYTDLPINKLAYVALYSGTSASTMAKSCSMSLTDLKIYNLNPGSGADVENNKIYFQEGDILDIDFNTRSAYLNHDECNDIVDIGSRFFNVGTGDTEIKFNSDDTELNADITFRENWSGIVD
ncbi:putative phage tail component, N-terminal domain-containing protein [Terrisporobacter glycolicus]|nr:putative phage tail component, N-terminal domain-containing protein [Terrisporobacter glycolicus]